VAHRTQPALAEPGLSRNHNFEKTLDGTGYFCTKNDAFLHPNFCFFSQILHFLHQILKFRKNGVKKQKCGV